MHSTTCRRAKQVPDQCTGKRPDSLGGEWEFPALALKFPASEPDPWTSPPGRPWEARHRFYQCSSIQGSGSSRNKSRILRRYGLPAEARNIQTTVSSEGWWAVEDLHAGRTVNRRGNARPRRNHRDGRSRCGRMSGAEGRSIRKRLPWPGSESTPTVPPMRSTARRTMVSPSPVPA